MIDANVHLDTATAPLTGLTVVDLSTTVPGALATMFLADCGAEVIFVEPSGGSPMRELPGWPALGRGKRSVVLDLHSESGKDSVRDLLRSADIAVTTMRPATAARLGFTPDALADLNPALVSASITGWGSSGPFKDYKGYEGLVMAKLGILFGKRQTIPRPGPSFVPTPFATWGASQTAVHGILTALFERESSGRGQHVEADLVRGMATLDTWNWFSELVTLRWPDAFTPVTAFDENGLPNGALIYPLLVTPTKDGHWMQFAQTAPRLFLALLTELGLDWMLTDPKWAGMPQLEDMALRIELWEMMLERASSRTLAEWQQVFDTNPDVSAEIFRSPTDALAHAQLHHDGRTVVFDDPELGPVIQPSTIVHNDGQALTPPRSAPRLGEYQTEIAKSSPQKVDTPTAPESGSGLPLAGVTILEVGSMFAGPYGTTLLTDMGARVVKIEPLGGDLIRGLVPFPEAGGAKVMQGKESITLDMRTPEGLAIVHAWAAKSDVVLQTYRAGAAKRAGIDADTLRAINPNLIYLSAPGYGTDGPYGNRPAYAPSIGAASGLALTDVPDAIEKTGSIEEIKATAIRLYAGGANLSAQADGISALAVASAILLGLYAHRRGTPMGELTATMLASSTHALIDRNIDYAGKPRGCQPDPQMYGYSALYRLYPASDGWIFLAAPKDNEWTALVKAMQSFVNLDQDKRFDSAALRQENSEALAKVLTDVFATRSKDAWERDLTNLDVGCVAAAEHTSEWTLQSDEFFEAGYSTLAMSPVFDEHRRLAPVTTFSRSSTKADGGCMAGEHTDALLAEIGYDDAIINSLRERSIVE
ncbi:CaiB/BaiF CoA transferase family protein [Rhodococcus sp. BH4]|uniref:CaiB/BaiF CoA transferase family protein n=1 Tax=Rhodococcus sp. BH4 TaxID=1807790 RepID=UPI0022B60034|nr:CoA transferase [Rhodococcus sp. BH4]